MDPFLVPVLTALVGLAVRGIALAGLLAATVAGNASCELTALASPGWPKPCRQDSGSMS